MDMKAEAMPDAGLPVSRRTIVTGYVIAAISLMFAEIVVFIAQPFTEARIPSLRPDYLPFALLFAVLVATGLLMGNYRNSRLPFWSGPFIACLTTAYALAFIAVAALGAWSDFAPRDLTFPVAPAKSKRSKCLIPSSMRTERLYTK